MKNCVSRFIPKTRFACNHNQEITTTFRGKCSFKVENSLFSDLCFHIDRHFTATRFTGEELTRICHDFRIFYLHPFPNISLSPFSLAMSSHTSDLKIGTPVATLPGAWRYRVSTGTGRPGVSILWLGEVEGLICSFYLSVAARQIVYADPSLRYTSLLLGR